METVKEKLNMLIHTAADYSVEMCERYVDCNSCPHFVDSCYAMTDYLIQNGVTIQEWVSVDERLPEKTGIYQIYMYDLNRNRWKVWYGQFVSTIGCWLVYDIQGDSIRCTVTHWMPLPELPKEK